MKYDPAEQDEVLTTFTEMLRAATKDGGKKRAAGLKVPWQEDPGHEAAMFRHLARWKTDPYGKDEDSGAHHLVAVAWRALAIAHQQSPAGFLDAVFPEGLPRTVPTGEPVRYYGGDRG